MPVTNNSVPSYIHAGLLRDAAQGARPLALALGDPLRRGHAPRTVRIAADPATFVRREQMGAANPFPRPPACRIENREWNSHGAWKVLKKMTLPPMARCELELRAGFDQQQPAL